MLRFYFSIISKCFFIFIAGLPASMLQSQVCSPDYFFKRHQGNSAVYTHQVITTAQQDVLSAGAVLKLNGEFQDATDGWITRLSPRGTVLWSKRYFVPGFNSGGFLAIENATDSTCLVTARFGRYKRRFDGSLEEQDAASFLIYINKFGNLIWVKRISQYITDSRLSSITRLKNNTFLIAGNVINGASSKILLLNTDLNGNMIWSKLFYADSVYLGTPVVKQLNNDQLLLTGITQKFGPGFTYTTDQGYYFFKKDPLTGSELHSSVIYFNRNPDIRPGGFDNIRSIIELPGDTLVFASSFSAGQSFGAVPGVREGILIKAGLNGQFYTAEGYYNTQPGCRLMDVKYSDGKYRLLLDDGYKTLYAEVNRGGDILNQKGYGNAYSLLQGYTFIEGSPAYRSLFTGRGQYPIMAMMKTENEGSIPCVETNSQLVKENVSSFFSTGPVPIATIVPSFPFAFEDAGNPIGWSAIPVTSTEDCLVTCCDGIPSDTTYTEICHALSYQLPDHSIIRESGLYYLNAPTANNCDSIAYYDIRFLKKPVIDLGADTCFRNNQPVRLQADSGFSSYTWNGVTTSQSAFTAMAPGTYTLSVSNQCGTAVDQIIIYEDCEFPVYMPSAFTPNQDGLNDLFMFPSQNKNRFLSLEIYNRYGQRVFYTTDAFRGWNGKIKNQDQPAGVYVYLLRHMTLDGNKRLKKGVLTLIR